MNQSLLAAARRRLRLWHVALVAAVVVAGAVVGPGLARPASELAVRALEVVGRAGPLGPALFVAAYVIASVAFIPASMFTMAAGALFGVLGGVAIVMVGAVLGASACFAIARGGGRGFVERRVAGDRRIVAIDRAIGARGLTIVLLLRLTPVIPFSPLNYALGLTRVRYRDFLIGSLGMIPAVFMYVSAGAAAGELVAVLSGARPARGAGAYALVGLGLSATIALTVYVTRLARRALHEAHLDE